MPASARRPFLGLALKSVAHLFVSLDMLHAGNMTILLLNQMAGLSLQLADYAYVIKDGRIVAQGDAACLQTEMRSPGA